ncbi:heterokaryon incompatibility protein [Colletotrichum musicola]|uniref:Heterokaryon incompatibility protein n=1 Tax=Colletotrichum musicola TaxID=2175873 RepID=A0A8H6IN40_9PEZI|nr:heterokaryon incompatibility protein [Colletotrichum musicola]
MCAVYSSATVTLSADGSNSADEGLFQTNQTLAALRYQSQRDDYLAGLWAGDLVAELAWKPPSPADLEAFRKVTNRPRIDTFPGTKSCEWTSIMNERNKREDWHQPDRYNAPSWSWAHLRGPISYLICVPRTPFVSYVDVIETKTIPMNPNEPTGQLASGFMILEGAHNFVIRFVADDWNAVNRRGCTVDDTAVMLLGTKNFLPAEVETGVIVGMSPSPDIIMRAQTEDDNKPSRLETPGLNSSPPKGLTKAFSRDDG